VSDFGTPISLMLEEKVNSAASNSVKTTVTVFTNAEYGRMRT
jgi:hypothetical protein